MYAKYFILVDSFCTAIGNERKAWERYASPYKTDSANIKRTDKMNRNKFKTEKPTAHLAHLVLPDTQANASQNQKS